MHKSDCIFCKIVKKEIPTNIIYEDKNNLAFLDVKPVMEGQSVVISKQHNTSDFKKVEDTILADLIKATKKTAKLLDITFKTRCCVVIEGFDIDHLHFKLYPTTPEDHLKLQPQQLADSNKLQQLAIKIRKNI